MDEAKAPDGQLLDIGSLAALNIVQALGLPDSAVASVKQAIRDEISALSSHFTMAVSDAHFHYDMQVRELKSTFNYAKENSVAITAVGLILIVLGFVAGRLI